MSFRSHPAHGSDALLAAIVDSSDDAIVSLDLDGLISSWNGGAQRIFGYTVTEAIGQPVTILLPPDRIDEGRDILARVRRGERVEHYDTIRRHKDGTLIEVSVTVSPIVDEHRGIVGASNIARDITALRHEQERWQATLASIGDAVISTNPQGLVVFMNPVAENLTGWRSSDAIGRPLSEVFRIVHELTRAPVESPVDRVLAEGVIVGLANHTILVARDGRERPIDDSAAPIRRATGGLDGVVLVFRDVTERRTAELSALRLAAIVQGSDDAIVGKNLQGIVTSWNPGAERIFGYAAEEMIGQSILRLIPDDRQNEEQEILGRLQRGERVDHFETLRRHKDGHLIDVSLTISPIMDSEGRVIGASKIARDITAQKQAAVALSVAQQKLQAHTQELESRIRERTEKLQETVGELEAFSYSLSHDMRAPLRAIQSFTEIVLTDFGDKIPEGVEYLNRVIAAAARMDRLIQDVLAFARLSRMEIHVAPLDVDALVRGIVHERPELHAPAATVTVEHPLLPVLGHDASLTQCLTNLLDNAVKFVAPGTHPQVHVFTEAKDHCVRLNVQDNGIGIDEPNQERLFAIFERLPTAHRYRGTGVGLAIVRKAAERMHGRVGVKSELGKGSTFWVELPGASG